MGYSKKEQAIRAKDSALEKMAKQDFSGAKKLALMARKLDPNVEDIAQMILVCNVHSRSGGDDNRDWYRVLDLDPKADVDSVRHQYNKMAFNLHPDKNRLPGATEAFRLVCRAAAVLSDEGRRRAYDSARRKSKAPEESRRSESGFSGFATFQDFSPAKLRESGFAKFRDGPGPFAEDYLNSTKDGDGNAKSGFAKFRNVAGAFDKGSLNGIDAKLQNLGFAGFQNGPGPFGQGVLNNEKSGAGNAESAKLQESGFAAFRNGFGPFDRGRSSNLKDGDGNANVQGLGFVTFQNGSSPFGRGFSSNLKDGARNANVQDSGFAKNIQNGPVPFDHCSGNNLKDGTFNAKVQESGFTKHGNGPGVFDRGSVNNGAGNAVQDSGFAKNIQNGAVPFDRSGNNLKDGTCNTKVQESGFTKHGNGSGVFDRGSVNNLKDGGGNGKVQDSGFAKTIQNVPVPFDHCSGNNLKDGTCNAKVQESGFTKHGNGSGVFDRGSVNNLIYGAGNAKVQDSGFAKKILNGPVPFYHCSGNNLKDGTCNAKVQESGFTEHVNGPGLFDRGSVNNLKDKGGNVKLQDSGFTTFRNGSGPTDHGSLNKLKDGAGNAKVQDLGFVKFRECPGPSCRGVSNNLRYGDGNGKLQDPSFANIQNGPGVFVQGVSNNIKHGDINAEIVKKANVSKPEENVKKVVKGQNRRVTATGENSANVEKSGAKPQFPGNFVARVIPNLRYSDSDLSDFEKGREKECFRPGQIWAVYDTLDAMPRFYARINNVVSFDNFKVHITWLEPCPDNEMEKKWLFKGLPASCGKFKLGVSEEIHDRAIFSHVVNSAEKDIQSSSTVYRMYPRKGETWAVFKNWKMDWCLDLEMQNINTGYEFDFVEITSDYCDDSGVSVGFLCKIKGFSTIFSRLNREEEVKILAKDKLGFSHRVLSFQMTSPNGSSRFFELDPASLPEYLNGFVSSEISSISEIFN